MKKNALHTLILSFCLFSSLTSCQSPSSLKTKKLSSSQDLVFAWKGDLSLEKDKKKYFLDLYLQSVRNKKLRIDIMTKWNKGIFTYVLTEKEVKYLLNHKKEYHYGKIEKKLHKDLQIFSFFPLKPKWVHAVLFDQAIQEKNWVCEKQDHLKKTSRKKKEKKENLDLKSENKKTEKKMDNSEEKNKEFVFAQSCKHLKKNMSLSWKTRLPLKEKILSFHYNEKEKVQLKINLKPLSKIKKKTSNKNPFDLIAPKNFKTFKLSL